MATLLTVVVEKYGKWSSWEEREFRGGGSWVWFEEEMVDAGAAWRGQEK